MFAMHMPEDMEAHLDLVSAARGLSKSEYVRTALAVALSAEPVVTPELVARLRAEVKRSKNTPKRPGNKDRGRDLVDA